MEKTLDLLYKKVQSGSSVHKEIVEYPHHEEVWVKWYQNFKKEKNKDALDQLRIVIITQTLNTLERGYFKLSKSKKVKLSFENEVKENILYLEAPKFTFTPNYIDEETLSPVKIEVLNEDCLDAYLKLKEKGYSPLCLNMCSSKKPGGGYMKGKYLNFDKKVVERKKRT